MEKIKKIFLEENLSWKKLLVFSVACGVITGIIPLINCLNNTSIHNIAECFEMWVLLALFVILKCKKPLEAGLKTFVFFLISQPLCYLVQVPFYQFGFGIFRFYKYWFFLTLLTFPGGMLAWYIKKENIFSMIILSFANLLLCIEFSWHFNILIDKFPYQLLAVIFILMEMLFFIYIIFKDKKKRIIMYVIIIFLLATGNFLIGYNQNNNETINMQNEVESEIVEYE